MNDLLLVIWAGILASMIVLTTVLLVLLLLILPAFLVEWLLKKPSR